MANENDVVVEAKKSTKSTKKSTIVFADGVDTFTKPISVTDGVTFVSAADNMEPQQIVSVKLSEGKTPFINMVFANGESRGMLAGKILQACKRQRVDVKNFFVKVGEASKVVMNFKLGLKAGELWIVPTA